MRKEEEKKKKKKKEKGKEKEKKKGKGKGKGKGKEKERRSRRKEKEKEKRKKPLIQNIRKYFPNNSQKIKTKTPPIKEKRRGKEKKKGENKGIFHQRGGRGSKKRPQKRERSKERQIL